MKGLLLDTHVWLWYAEGIAGYLSPATLEAIEQARIEHRLYVSAISVWEIGMLYANGRISLSTPVSEWMRWAIAKPGLRLQPLDADIALESTQLPGNPHGDPADRFLMAAARVHDLCLVTSDAKINDYGKAGHAHVMVA